MFTVEFRYNDNYGEVEFPCDENYLLSRLDELRVEDVLNPQLTAVKIDIDELQFVEGKKISLDELNFLAKYLERLTDEDVDTVLAIVQAKHIDTLQSTINAAFLRNNYTLVQNMSNMEQKDKDLTNSGKGIVTGKGVLFEHENAEQQEFYNGKTFPLYLYENCMYVADMEYDGAHEYLYLPTIPLAIHKAIFRLGAKSSENCSITICNQSQKGSEWLETIARIANDEGIDIANHITARINNMSAKTRLKLIAVMDFANRKDGESIIKLADNLDSFSFYKDVSDLMDLGHAIIANEDYSLDMDLVDYFQYEQFAEDRLRRRDSKFMEIGVVILNRKTLSEILDETQENSMDLRL